MHGLTAIHRINEDKKNVLRLKSGPEASWTCAGLDRAIARIKELIKEERILRAAQIDMRLAGSLFRAIKRAHGELQAGRDGWALQVLERALKRAQRHAKRPKTHDHLQKEPC